MLSPRSCTCRPVDKKQLQRLWKRFNLLDRTGNGRITRCMGMLPLLTNPPGICAASLLWRVELAALHDVTACGSNKTRCCYVVRFSHSPHSRLRAAEMNFGCCLSSQAILLQTEFLTASSLRHQVVFFDRIARGIFFGKRVFPLSLSPIPSRKVSTKPRTCICG